MDAKLVVKVFHGNYQLIIGSVPEAGQFVPETGQFVPETEHLKTDRPENGTVRIEVSQKWDSSNRPENGTFRPADGTVRPADGTKCPENETLPPAPQESTYLSKVKLSKEREFLNSSLKEVLERAKADPEKFNFYQTEARSAFKEKGTSPDLWDRIAVGRVLQLPGFDRQSMAELKEEAYKARLAGEIKYGWYRIAKYVKLCFEKAGIPWEKCRSPKEVFLDEQHEKRINKPGPGVEPQEEPAPAEVDPIAAAEAAASCRREVMESARKIEAEQKAAAAAARERRANAAAAGPKLISKTPLHRPEIEQQNAEDVYLPKLKSASPAPRSSPIRREPATKPGAKPPAEPKPDAMSKGLQKLRNELNNPKPTAPDPGFKFVKSKPEPRKTGRKSA